ncbi:acyl-CoA thioesterase [Georgenia sp. Z1491]|uniref:acyl-CoA thioesterase n=1 Tax=Georgenia sp. Z1491 TaxID=3416707 RepID=UPI003CFA2673
MRTHRYRTAVKWVDTDASGRIHNTAAFRWAEAAEHSLYEIVCPELGATPFPRRTVAATYHRALVFRDAIEVELRVVRLGRSSIGYEWTVVADDQPAIEGNHVAIYVDESGRPAPLPETLRAGLEAATVGVTQD